MQQHVGAAIAQVEAGDRLRDGCGRGSPPTRRIDASVRTVLRSGEGRPAILLVRALRRCRAGDIARPARSTSISSGSKPAQIAVPDQVVRVPMMALVADQSADVVEQQPRIRATRVRDRSARAPPGFDRRARAPAASPAERARRSSCNARLVRARCAAGHRGSCPPARSAGGCDGCSRARVLRAAPGRRA